MSIDNYLRRRRPGIPSILQRTNRLGGHCNEETLATKSGKLYCNKSKPSITKNLALATVSPNISRLPAG